MSVVGLLAGLVAALAVTRLTANLLYGSVQPIRLRHRDRPTALVRHVAGMLLPARRATKVDPIIALRIE